MPPKTPPAKPAKPPHKPPPTPPPAPPPVAKIVYPKFAPTSFWYQPIPVAAALNANSDNLVQTFLGQVGSGVGCNIYQYTAPVFNPPPGTVKIPVVAFDCFSQGWIPAGLQDQWDAVPFPTFAGPSAGTDEEMAIYDPATDTYWEFWQLQHLPAGGWQACRGGAMTAVSSNPGYWSGGFGAAATGLPFAAGQIRADELQAGAINHVMGLAVGAAETWSTWSWPAQRSDGWNPDNIPNQIAEGLRCRLDPALDVASLDIHPIAKIVAKAAQTYGFVVWDKTGSTPSLRFENAASFTALGQPDPYLTLLNGTPDYGVLSMFPWDRLQFMPMNYGQPSG